MPIPYQNPLIHVYFCNGNLGPTAKFCFMILYVLVVLLSEWYMHVS